MRSLVNVIVVSWNGRNWLERCLKGLREQLYRPFEVTLIDNASQDGSVEFTSRQFPEVNTIALAKNFGFSIANNIAINATEADYFALLNQDAIPHPLWLKSLVDALKNHPEAGFAASKMLLYDKKYLIDRAGDAYTRCGTGLLRGRCVAAENFNKKEMIFGACAGAALYRADALKDVGLFDEDFFLLYEDVDLSFRAQLRGYKCVYVPEAIVYHKASSSIVHDSPVSVYYSHRNLEWVYIKNMPSKLILKTLVPHFIYIICAFIFFLARKRGLVFLRAKIDALRGLRSAFEKRKIIQKSKKVSDNYVLGLIEKENFVYRMRYRFKKT